MNSEAYGTTVFCDDIRYETNGKLTLIGCYTGEMNFSGPAPGLLPNFGALVNLRVPINVEINTIKLCVYLELASSRDEIFSTEIEITDEQRKSAFAGTENERPEDKVLSMTFPLHWSPLPVNEKGRIKVRAYLDNDIEVRLGTLKMNFVEGDGKGEEA